MRTPARFVIGLAALVSAAAVVQTAAPARDYPERPVKIVVPYAPGGAVDVLARIIGQKLSERAGNQFYVENLAGASGEIGVRAVASARADGYTLLFTSPDFVPRPLVKSNAPYDPLASFAPVTLVATSPNLISIHASVPARTMKELAGLLRASPGKYTIGTPGFGSAPHLEAERLYRQNYGLDVVYVPFQGFGPAVTSAVAGHTAILGAPVGLVEPYVKDGTLRALAIASGKRYPALQDVPTLAEAGVADQESGFAGGVVAPAGTPKEIVNLLHHHIVAALSAPDMQVRLAALGYDPVGSTPEEFSAWIKAELAKWSAVVRATNIRID
jgi:tripartite-type tricarboxylate transporter receptor subunit TctC